MLLPRAANSKVGRQPFGVKKKTYVKVSETAREVSEYPCWDLSSIQDREEKLLSFARQEWS